MMKAETILVIILAIPIIIVGIGIGTSVGKILDNLENPTVIVIEHNTI